jgi:DNA polymerase-3 subunit beta
MRFSISSDELKDKLQTVAGAISSNPVIPILEDFLFRIESGKLTISASDLETTIYTEMPVNSDEDGSVAIPAKILLDTLKALPTQPVTFTVDPDTYAVEIKSAFGKYKLAGENGDDYPRVPAADQVDQIEIPSKYFVRGINKCLFATSNDELRIAMMGVLFQIDFNGLTFVATDAHKLVKYTFSKSESGVSTSFIVPKKALNLLKNALPAGEDKVKISFNKSNAFFQFDNLHLICRLIDSRYPDYNAVIPVENPNKMTIARADFQNSLKRIAIYANKTTNQVVLNLSDGSLTLTAQDLDFSNEAVEQLPCEYDGSDMLIGFNAKFLAEMMGVLETDKIRIEMSTPSRAGIIFPADQAEGEDVLMLIMPVMLGN